MTRLTISGFVAALFAAAIFLPAPATAGPMGLTNSAADATLVQKTGWERRRWWRSNGYETDVDAPTTSVRTNDANTDVDAPFTSVRKTPSGTYVRAPFVNLFVPRD